MRKFGKLGCIGGGPLLASLGKQEKGDGTRRTAESKGAVSLFQFGTSITIVGEGGGRGIVIRHPPVNRGHPITIGGGASDNNWGGGVRGIVIDANKK